MANSLDESVSRSLIHQDGSMSLIAVTALSVRHASSETARVLLFFLNRFVAELADIFAASVALFRPLEVSEPRRLTPSALACSIPREQPVKLGGAICSADTGRRKLAVRAVGARERTHRKRRPRGLLHARSGSRQLTASATCTCTPGIEQMASGRADSSLPFSRVPESWASPRISQRLGHHTIALTRRLHPSKPLRARGS